MFDSEPITLFGIIYFGAAFFLGVLVNTKEARHPVDAGLEYAVNAGFLLIPIVIVSIIFDININF